MARSPIRVERAVSAGLFILALACDGSSEQTPTPDWGIINLADEAGVWWVFAQYGGVSRTPCNYERFGVCLVTRACAPDDSPSLPATFQAGTLTVQGTAIPFDTGGFYSGSLSDALQPGDAIDVAATGSADVPAHAGTVVRPTAITVLEPSFETIVAVDRSRDLEVVWTEGAEGTVSFALVVDDTRQTGVYCDSPSRAGTMIVPSEALQELPPTDESVTARIGVSQADTAILRPEGWEIWLGVPGPRGGSGDAAVY